MMKIKKMINKRIIMKNKMAKKRARVKLKPRSLR